MNEVKLINLPVKKMVININLILSIDFYKKEENDISFDEPMMSFTIGKFLRDVCKITMIDGKEIELCASDTAVINKMLKEINESSKS